MLRTKNVVHGKHERHESHENTTTQFLMLVCHVLHVPCVTSVTQKTIERAADLPVSSLFALNFRAFANGDLYYGFLVAARDGEIRFIVGN